MNIKDTQAKVNQTEPKSVRKEYPCGNALRLVVESISKGGGKSYAGRMRFNGKQRTIWIGSTKKIKLKQARQKFEEIRLWSKQNDKDPTSYKNIGKVRKSSKTFKHLIDAYIQHRTDLEEVTLRNYKRQLYQALEIINGSTSLTDLEWDRDGRDLVLAVRDHIENRGSHSQAYRVQNTLHRIFEYAISRKWIERGQNPAIVHKAQIKKHIRKNNPAISWKQVPTFLRDLQENKCNGSPVTVLAVKTMLMTFLRASALVRLQWDWYDEETDCFIIPSETKGLKRRKGVTDKHHHVPMTEPLRAVLNQVRRYTGHQKYVFWSARGGEFAHISPELPNKHLINLGYKGLLTAHGIRQLALTAGQDQFRGDAEIIRRQMGHLIKDPVQKAYDKSIRLEERREFLTDWCDALVEAGLRV